MVAVPTSKLRFACSSCWPIAIFCASRERDVVLREQHVEVGLRHAQDQVLRRERELRVGLLDLRSAPARRRRCSAAGRAAASPTGEAEFELKSSARGTRRRIARARARGRCTGVEAGSEAEGSRPARPCGSFSWPAAQVARAAGVRRVGRLRRAVDVEQVRAADAAAAPRAANASRSNRIVEAAERRIDVLRTRSARAAARS